MGGVCRVVSAVGKAQELLVALDGHGAVVWEWGERAVDQLVELEGGGHTGRGLDLGDGAMPTVNRTCLVVDHDGNDVAMLRLGLGLDAVLRTAHGAASRHRAGRVR